MSLCALLLNLGPSSQRQNSDQIPEGGGGVLPYMGYIGMCGPKGYGFSTVLVINRVSILAILVINWVWFLHSSLDIGMFLRRS